MMLVEAYINEVLGQDIHLTQLPDNRLAKLPIYITEGYKLSLGGLFGREVLFAEPKDPAFFSILQTERQLSLLRKNYSLVVLLLPRVSAIIRKRLIEKRISFIVPGKQLYLPELLVDLREVHLGEPVKRKSSGLLPSAQFLVIYHIIHRYSEWKLEDNSFKNIAERTGYTPMAITKAVENLRYEEVIDVIGEKERFIRFRLERGELWNDLLNRKLLIDPVLKKVFVDSYRHQPRLLLAGTSALPEYSDMNPVRQVTYAISRHLFYASEDEGVWKNLNQHDGETALEVWKYDPEKLADGLVTDLGVVDPLSLYLSLQNSTDERTEMALEQILKKYIW